MARRSVLSSHTQIMCLAFDSFDDITRNSAICVAYAYIGLENVKMHIHVNIVLHVVGCRRIFAPTHGMLTMR